MEISNTGLIKYRVGNIHLVVVEGEEEQEDSFYSFGLSYFLTLLSF